MKRLTMTRLSIADSGLLLAALWEWYETTDNPGARDLHDRLSEDWTELFLSEYEEVAYESGST